MSYPTNINATDHDDSRCAEDDWIPSSVTAANQVCHGAGKTFNSAVNRGMKILKSVHKKIGMEANAACMLMHKHPYLSVLAGLGGGLAIGYLVAGKNTDPD